MIRGVALFLFISLASAKHEIYDGHRVFKVSVKSTDQVQFLKDLENQLGVDVWSESTPNHPGLVLVSGDKNRQFLDALEAKGIQYDLEVENIKELLDLEEKLLQDAHAKNRTRSRASALPLDQIYRYDEVNAYLEEIASAYPNIVTLVSGGQSFEGRDIKYLKISTTNFQDLNKPVVYVQSLLHAREWITLAATLYAIQKLVIDVTHQELQQDFDWIIVPIANPDGYEFTHTNQRFWRKNRATGYIPGDQCAGVDLNRNFDFFWSQSSSNLVCSDIFHGRAPFSEPETAIIRDIVNEHKDRIALFLDIHSFGSMILYGYGDGKVPPNVYDIHLIGFGMSHTIDSVKMSWNDKYIVGNVAMALYPTSGSAMDYAQSLGVQYSYTFELPGYRNGLRTATGFLVDPAFIEQAGFETWEGIRFGAVAVRNRLIMKRVA